MSKVGTALKVVRQLARHPVTASTVLMVLQPVGSSWPKGEPWFNPRAMRYLQRRLQAGHNVFEWGTGGSTLWLISRGARVISVDDDAEWAERVRARCPSADIRLIPGTASGTLPGEPKLCVQSGLFYDDYVHAVDQFADDHFDVVIVDGVCRIECARRAVSKVKPGGLLTFDDSQWPFLAGVDDVLAGWPVVKLKGFKDRTGELLETSFYTRPG